MNKRIRKKKGLSKIREEEVWSLDITLAKYILPRLIKFKEVNTMSYPCSFKNIEEWHKIIDKMIFSFDYVLNGKNHPFISLEEEMRIQKRYKEGMDYFSEFFI